MRLWAPAVPFLQACSSLGRAVLVRVSAGPSAALRSLDEAAGGSPQLSDFLGLWAKSSFSPTGVGKRSRVDSIGLNMS